MHVVEIWRYPIKSVGGERLEVADIGSTGIVHDRGWGLVDDHTGNVLTARREPRLLFGSARMVDGEPVVTIESGDELRTSADFSEWLDRPVTLCSAAGADGGTYENPLDFENDESWVSWQGPGEAWHDSARTRVSLVSRGTIGDWDGRRFRPNLIVDGGGEDAFVDLEISVGDVRLSITKRIGRCVIVTRPQPGVDRDLDVLRTINAHREGFLAIGALVVAPGTIRPGDAVVVG
ncbi:MAG: MOSC N-terminal beta barrel domain-containing protein [Acidimicrobiales bacterium]